MFAIANAYWLPMLERTADVDKALDDFQRSGMEVLRIWGFADLTGNPGSQTAFQVSYYYYSACVECLD